MIFLLLAFSLLANAETIAIEDVVKKTSYANYQVLAEAQRVYQAKESVNVARGELLPSLNIWKIIGAILDPISLITQDIAPFLVPSNWFRLKQSEKLYLAEREAYRALWANQVYSGKSLYLQILADQNVLAMIQAIRTNLTEFESLAAQRERIGGLEPGVTRDLRIKILTLEEDSLRLAQLLKNEKGTLNQFLGMDANISIDLRPVSLPDLSSITPLDPMQIQTLALAASPEIAQHKEFLEVLKSVRKENRFSFLGLASNHRGVAGGIFDSLPIASGLGFATAPSLKIVEAERDRLNLQLKGIEETIKRDTNSIVSQFNLELQAYELLFERVTLSREYMDIQKKRLQFGQDIDPIILSETYKNYVSAENSLLQARLKFLIFRERIMRLTLSEDYKEIPVKEASLL
jgi:outer membrane protein, multidrug efflux system